MPSGKKKKSKRKAQARLAHNPIAPAIPSETKLSTRQAPAWLQHSRWLVPIFILSLCCAQIGLVAALHSNLAAGAKMSDWQIIYLLIGQLLAGIISIIIYPSLRPSQVSNYLIVGVLTWLLSSYLASIAYSLSDLAGAILVFGAAATALVFGSSTNLFISFKPHSRWSIFSLLAPLAFLVFGIWLPMRYPTHLDWRWIFRFSLIGGIMILLLCWWEKTAIIASSTDKIR